MAEPDSMKASRSIRGSLSIEGVPRANRCARGSLAQDAEAAEAAREPRVRHLATQQGLELRKHRGSARTLWMIFDPWSEVTILDNCTLDEADHRLREGVVHPSMIVSAQRLVSVSG
jgi:hypothetical protein